MAEESQNKGKVIATKKGVPVYETNPSVPNPDSISKRRPVRIGNEKKGFVIDGGGEVLGQGSAMFYEFEEVDDARFVKLYLSGFKKARELSTAGLAVFELVYRQVQDKPNTDEVKLNFYSVSNQIAGLTERTYQRGLRELLDKEFLFRSPYDGVFFVNIRYIFNGDRLTFAKGVMRKKSKAKPENQLDLFAGAPDALPAPKDEE